MKNTISNKILVLTFLVLQSFSVSGQNKIGYLKKGDKLFYNLAYSKAIPFYVKYYDANPGNNEVEMKIADCYRMINDPVNAELWYGEALDGGPQICRFYYATALMQNEKFNEAKVQFAKFIELNPSNPLANVRYKSCLEYKKFYQDSGRYSVWDAGINSSESDFSPAPMGDKIVISSSREDDDFWFAWLNKRFLDLFSSDNLGTMDLSDPVRLKGLVNTKFHEATASFSTSGDTLYFTRNNFYRGKVEHDTEGTLLLQTYSSAKKGDKWTSIRELNFNNKEYSTGHPTLFDNGNKMIIISDMPGTEGGTDLYLVKKEGNIWGEPMNLGSVINSTGNEMFPWVSPDGTLFFASNGHEGLGGLDIFMSTYENGKWNKPMNLGYPINTTMDDFGLIVNADEETGYLSSNRLGGMGDDDIYAFSVHKQILVTVVDATTKEPIEDAVLKIFMYGDEIGYSNTNDKGEGRVYGDGGGPYLVKVNEEGYDPNEVVVSPGNKNPFEPYKVTVELVKQKEACPPMAVLDGRIITENKNLPPGATVTIREKETGLVISPNLKFNYGLEIGKDYEVEVNAPDHKPMIYDVETEGHKANDTLDLAVTLTKEDIGKVFYIIYYNFDKHDIRQDASVELERVVTYMKKYPKIKVELSSHTDARGTSDYNMGLSKQRASEAYNYITSHGVSADRISFKWFGETMPTNKCKDNQNCSEEEHQLNRRTEFKLVGM